MVVCTKCQWAQTKGVNKMAHEPFMNVGYVVVSFQQCGPKITPPWVITVLQVLDTPPNDLGQNCNYIYKTNVSQHRTLLRAVKHCAGHGNRVKLTWLNHVCCTTELGYCQCPGLGVSI